MIDRIRQRILKRLYIKPYFEPLVILLILIGFIRWFDIPHIHHPLISLKISLEEKVGRY